MDDRTAHDPPVDQTDAADGDREAERSCWGCASERGDDHGLGPHCRAALIARRTSPDTPALNVLIDKLASVYAHLCWHCQAALAIGIDGLCGRCRAELR